MLQSEFETLTGIYPDVLLYEAAEHEYNTGDYASKAEFCDCFKADEDGLATKCQRIANERWFKAEEHIGKLTAENNRLEDENENLRNEIAALSDRVDELNDEIVELPAVLETTDGFTEAEIERIRAAMQRALQDAACDDCKGDEILHMIWGFDYLLRRLGVE
jgi:predicted nuclease with TOPRIM domain